MGFSKYPDALSSPEKTPVIREGDIEESFIGRLEGLKYTIHAVEKKMFREILGAFLDRYEFVFPKVLGNARSAKVQPAAPVAPAKAAAKTAKKTAPKAPTTAPTP